MCAKALGRLEDAVSNALFALGIGAGVGPAQAPGSESAVWDELRRLAASGEAGRADAGSAARKLDAAIEAARGYDAICICSTDEKYPALVPALCEKLQGKTLILAGYPADMVESYKAQGIDIFIHIRANVLDTLKELAHSMGVNQ